MRCSVGIAYGKELELYSFPPPHPFNSERVKSFFKKLEESNVTFKKIKPVLAGEEELSLFHSSEHIEFVKNKSIHGTGFLDNGDTPAFKGIFEVSCFVVGSTLECVKSILKKEVGHAINPVGGLHHARNNASAGFCVFNDICIMIEMLKRNGVKRILYVDIDVHHGDGVFYHYDYDENIWIFDVHEDFRVQYPGTGKDEEKGKGNAEGTKLNINLRPGEGDEKIDYIVSKLDEFAKNAKPEFILMQCGADSLRADLLGRLEFSKRYHQEVAYELHKISHLFCDGRLVALGGGGYNPKNCADAWLSVFNSLVEYKI